MTLSVRRTAGHLMVAALLTLTVAGCGADKSTQERAPGEHVTLTFWSWVPGMDKAVDLWNEQNPEVQIELSTVAEGNAGGYAKMRAALEAGDPPDLAQVEYQEIPSFLIDQGLVDLSQHGAETHRDKFVDWQWQQGVFNDKVYAIPQASGPMGMFYRADLFEEWDIAPPETWDEFATAAAQVREHDAYLSTFPPANSPWFSAMAWQAGAQWFGTSNGDWTVDIDDDTTRKVAEYWDDLVQAGHIKTDPDMSNAWYKDLQDGQIVSWIGPQWGDELLRGNAPQTSGDWKVAPIPQWSESDEFTSSNWGGSSTALLNGGDYPKEAMDFAVWLNTDPRSVDLLIEGGYGWPAVNDALSGSALDRADPFFGDQRYNEVFAQADAAIDTDWRWSPTSSETYEHLNTGFQAAIDGNGSFTDAISRAQREVVADMEAKGLPVETR